MKKRTFLLAGATAAAAPWLAGCTTTGQASSDPAARRKAIDSDVDRALSDLYKQAAGSRELVGRARGVLVFPSMISAGFVVGAGTGEGALREGGRTSAYYRMTTVSVGWLAGARSAAVFYLFNTNDALQKFKTSSGWQVGADAGVSVLNVGANARVDTESAQQPITAFVLTNVGLMANASLDGSRITRLEL